MFGWLLLFRRHHHMPSGGVAIGNRRLFARAATPALVGAPVTPLIGVAAVTPAFFVRKKS